MNKRYLVIQTGLCAVFGLASAISFAGQLSSNFTATSNYIWRGVSQTNDEAALQGGIDYTINKNYYAGAWTSNVKNGTQGDYELDLYAGYTNKFGKFDFDAGIIAYQYPGDAGIRDYAEIYAGTAYKNYSGKISVDLSKTNIYIEGAADFELPDKYLLTAHLGLYSFNQAGQKDYIDYNATISKGELSFMISNTDLAGDNVKVNISWNKNF